MVVVEADDSRSPDRTIGDQATGRAHDRGRVQATAQLNAHERGRTEPRGNSLVKQVPQVLFVVAIARITDCLTGGEIPEGGDRQLLPRDPHDVAGRYGI